MYELLDLLFFASNLLPLSFCFGSSTKDTRTAIWFFVENTTSLCGVWRFFAKRMCPELGEPESGSHNIADQTELPEMGQKKVAIRDKNNICGAGTRLSVFGDADVSLFCNIIWSNT